MSCEIVPSSACGKEFLYCRTHKKESENKEDCEEIKEVMTLEKALGIVQDIGMYRNTHKNFVPNTNIDSWCWSKIVGSGF